jgi:hypothetical protein
MDGLLRKQRGIFLTCVIGLIALISISYLVRLPAVQSRRGLKLLAATQVGQTTADDFRKMAARSGVRLEETSNTLGVLQRNRLLEYIHLAPPTVVLINARVVAGVVTAISVRAWIGNDREFAKISIDERDSHRTSCGDVPLCVQPTSSTTTTYVFFRPSTPIAQREQLLSLNVRCLSKVGGCKNSREFFPAAWEHDQP